jgi:hypothetical protein
MDAYSGAETARYNVDCCERRRVLIMALESAHQGEIGSIEHESGLGGVVPHTGCAGFLCQASQPGSIEHV